MSQTDTTDPSLKTKHIVIFGFGSQGSAQAQNLRDGGYQVSVVLRPGSKNIRRATEAGLTVLTDVQDAAQQADVLVLLIPDEVQRAFYEEYLKGNLRPKTALIFAHGFNIHYKQIIPPNNVDVILVAPKCPGFLLRESFLKKHGVPCLVAVHQDMAGQARDLATTYAEAIGCRRAGQVEISFKEETEANLFSEQAVLSGGMTTLMKAGFEILAAAGFSPEVAYLECLDKVGFFADMVRAHGIAGMYELISRTAAYGDLTRGPVVIDESVKEKMKKILANIQSGSFADEWLKEYETGLKNFKRLKEGQKNHPIERAGDRLKKGLRRN